MPSVCSYFPPGIIEHVFEPSTTPTQYFIFWSVGGFMVCITGMLIYPRAREFWILGNKIREERNLVLVPFGPMAYRLIVLFPLSTSIVKYFTFIMPSSIYTVDFIIHFYEGIVLFFFAQLLIMYLGTLENSAAALKETEASKFYAVPPFGCCLKPCISSANMTHKDFRCLYGMVLQFTIVTPLFTFMITVRSWIGQTIVLQILAVLDLISSMMCVYALFALMTAAHGILKRHKIHHKFWCIKGILIVFIIHPYDDDLYLLFLS